MSNILTGAVSFFESFVEYLTCILKLQGYRLKRETTALLWRCGVYVAALTLGLIALVFLSVGLALWLAALLGSIPAGLALVGGLYLLLAAIAAAIAGRDSATSRAGIPFSHRWSLRSATRQEAHDE